MKIMNNGQVEVYNDKYTITVRERKNGIRLTPCPFCGENDRLNMEAYQCDGEFWHYVFCEECLAEGPVGKTEQDTVDAWNERDYRSVEKNEKAVRD